jgi:4-hydroxythreonine-4-phosphate dehydrogenase
MSSRRPTIAISMGDPGGIGPEVLVRALTDRAVRASARYAIHGSSATMHRAAEATRTEPFWWRVDARSALGDTAGVHDVVLFDSDPELAEQQIEPVFENRPTKLGGMLSFRWVEAAIADAQRPPADPRHADAVVTGPISKEAWSLAGKGRWPGHTELFADRFKSKRFAMMFVGSRLRVVLATVHVPLMEVRGALTIGAVHTAIDLGNDACKRLGFKRPRIGVAGLNPHAGEQGLLGDEEQRIITPAIELAVRQGMDASGPFPGDTIFNTALQGRFDLVVAMYHDQGLIPVKLLERDLAVNTTLGLPVVRTSPDHGTAYDIAGTGKADPGSMISAIRLAAKLAVPVGAPEQV